MNCEICQELIHDLIDGSITQSDEFTLNTHLRECLDCDSVRQDLASIVGFCRTQRGVYEAPPNEQALWLRIRNIIEAERPRGVASGTEPRRSCLAAGWVELGTFIAAVGGIDGRQSFCLCHWRP